ncbi:MAG: rod shape-determining protein MreD, partial [Duodenibacillus sp.]|nr:rod shape-determining protein MreD [Duodenibacillus sp.]
PWVWLTLIAGCVFNMLPVARWAWTPDFLALALCFWFLNEPRLLGMSAPMLFGLVADVYQGSVLGQTSLAYVLVSYGAYALHKRLAWFTAFWQALYVLPLLLGAQCIVLFTRVWLGAQFPGWAWFGESLAGALIWPLWSFALSLPMRRGGAGFGSREPEL